MTSYLASRHTSEIHNPRIQHQSHRKTLALLFSHAAGSHAAGPHARKDIVFVQLSVSSGNSNYSMAESGVSLCYMFDYCFPTRSPSRVLTSCRSLTRLDRDLQGYIETSSRMDRFNLPASSPRALSPSLTTDIASRGSERGRKPVMDAQTPCSASFVPAG
ncbi:hypothetical protein BDV97DRAFT_209186 [Delphinella strobiligena]|nr:hypothetical protein BDV97DRAFT_209186 [Delphinella strobiligena]